MASVRNGRHLFNETVPAGGLPEPGKTTVYDNSQTIYLETVPLNGGFLLKTLVLSMDPYVFGRMKSGTGLPQFNIGKPLNNHGVGVVIRSENPAVKRGDYLFGYLTFEEYSVVQDAKRFRILPNEPKLPWSAYVGAIGMPGQTAYYGWREFSSAKKGETVFVSSGSGIIGSIVIQLAKREGLKIIASAGSDDKVEFLKTIGTDLAFNYKTTSTREVLEKEGGIDIYWDNVGGATMEAAIYAAKRFARFIECGMISTITGDNYHVKNLMMIVQKQISVFGFISTNLHAKYETEFYEVLPHLVAKGELKYMEDVNKGLESVGKALYALLTGGNRGKSIVSL